MRWLLPFLLALTVFVTTPDVTAADFKLADGSVVTGELVAPNDDGTVIRRTSGGLTSRLSWDRFSQETLIEFAREPKLKEFVEAFIDIPAGAEEARPVITVNDPPGKIVRPAKRPGFFAAFGTPAGWFILVVMLVANLYAAYEISVFRNYPAAAVIGTSIILPILGPALFLFMPTRVTESAHVESEAEATVEAPSTGAQDLAAAGLAGSALSLSAGGHKGGAAPAAAAQTTSYKRSETEFNRAFFEKAFPLFFRVTRTDADKGSTLAIRSSKGEVVATRISRISSNEIGLVTQKGHEVQLRFADIVEVQLRPKSA